MPVNFLVPIKLSVAVIYVPPPIKLCLLFLVELIDAVVLNDPILLLFRDFELVPTSPTAAWYPPTF